MSVSWTNFVFITWVSFYCPYFFAYNDTPNAFFPWGLSRGRAIIYVEIFCVNKYCMFLHDHVPPGNFPEDMWRGPHYMTSYCGDKDYFSRKSTWRTRMITCWKNKFCWWVPQTEYLTYVSIFKMLFVTLQPLPQECMVYPFPENCLSRILPREKSLL